MKNLLMSQRPPVVFFVYKRPAHTRRTLEALARCQGAQDTDLYVFCDGPKAEADAGSVAEVRALVKAAQGFRSVNVEEAAQNRGLAASVIAGVGQVLGRHGACIVVEDDLDLAPGFLDFLAGALERYRDDDRVFSLSGYGPPVSRVPVEPKGSVWFSPRPCSWGWAIWNDRWVQVDWSVADRDVFFGDARARRQFERGGRDLSYFLRQQFQGQLDSWAVRLAWSQSQKKGLTVYPTRSFVDNRGLDGSGTHSRNEGPQGINLDEARLPTAWPDPFEPNSRVLAAFRRHYEGTWTERWSIRWQKVRRLWGKKR